MKDKHGPCNKDHVIQAFSFGFRSAQLKKLRDVVVKSCILYKYSPRPDGSRLRLTTPLFDDFDDPDEDYVLTMDNAKKILAIHQRLRFVY